MSEWQPIETAPKNGRGILLLERIETRDGRTVHGCSIGHWIPKEWGFEPSELWVSGETGDPIEGEAVVTHWMPLPEPPETT